MKVFVTGGSGFIGEYPILFLILAFLGLQSLLHPLTPVLCPGADRSELTGSHVIPVLIAQGHTITAIARSEASSTKLKSLGATPIAGDLSSLDVIRQCASEADAVIHMGFIHDFDSPSHSFAHNIATDRAALYAMAEGLGKDSGKILINTSGVVGRTAPGVLYTEDQTEQSPIRPDYVKEFVEMGLKAYGARMAPTVHGDGDQGWVPLACLKAKQKGYMGYVGDGQGRISAGHISDVAQVYGQILAKAASGELEAGTYYHGVGEESVKTKDLSEAIARRVGVEARSVSMNKMKEDFGFVSLFFGFDSPCSFEITKKTLEWTPKGPILLEDVANSSSCDGTYGGKHHEG